MSSLETGPGHTVAPRMLLKETRLSHNTGRNKRLTNTCVNEDVAVLIKMKNLLREDNTFRRDSLQHGKSHKLSDKWNYQPGSSKQLRLGITLQ